MNYTFLIILAGFLVITAPIVLLGAHRERNRERKKHTPCETPQPLVVQSHTMAYTANLHHAVVSYLEELDRWRNNNIPSNQLSAAESELRAVIRAEQTALPEESAQITIRRKLPKLRGRWYRVDWRTWFGKRP